MYFLSLLFGFLLKELEAQIPSYTCPPVGSCESIATNSEIDISSARTSSASITISVSSKGYDGNLCILSLLSPDSEQHVARTYDDRDWELTAGHFVDRVEKPNCDAEGTCTLTIPTNVETLGEFGEKQYVLTSYNHEVGRR